MGLFREISSAVSGHGHGCGCDVCLDAYNGSDSRGVDRTLLWRCAAAAALFAAACIVRASAGTASLLLAVASILCAGYDRLIRAFAVCVREKRFDEELLMSIVVIAAIALGRPLESAAGMLLMQIASVFASFIEEKTRRKLSSLTEDGASAKTDGTKSSRAEEFMARFSRLYTPIVLGIAVVIAVITPIVFHTAVREGIYRALILLVIACPCSLITAISLTGLAGVGSAADQGTMIRSTYAIDALSRVSTVVFDQKTALEGDGLRVVSVKSDRMDADTLLRIAAHACAYSDGMYAECIKAAYHDTIYIELIQSFQQEPGRGITVEVDGVSIILGLESFIREHGVDPGVDAVAEPCAYLAIDGKYAGRILLGALAKPLTSEAVAALSWESDRHVVMLTEDPASAAEKFVRLAGIDQYYADCTAASKADILRDLKERGKRSDTLLFAGDPKLDPACFAAADVRVAASDNVDVDVYSADSAPVTVVRAIDTAKRTRSVMRQSVFGILVFKLLILALDMLGVCPLWLAIFADAGMAFAASVCALRALVPKETPLVKEDLA